MICVRGESNFFFERVVELAPLIAVVTEQRRQKGYSPTSRKRRTPAVAILYVNGRTMAGAANPAYLPKVALLALDLFARSIAMRSIRAPLFFRRPSLLWLVDACQSVGLRIRVSPCSRHGGT